jgi:hypothetical protein
MASSDITQAVVVLDQGNGITLIPNPTGLTRLNYYDGKFLRADDLSAEQKYLRTLVQLSNRAGGPGVVYGFDLARLGGDRLRLGAGLAVDAEGRGLFMPEASEVGIAGLIEQSSKKMSGTAAGTGGTGAFSPCESGGASGSTTQPVAGVALYVVGISLAEALCGQEDVYGKLCEEACVTGTERPYRLEGVLLQALPLPLSRPLPDVKGLGLVHLRSRVASAYFAGEGKANGYGVSAKDFDPASEIWCSGAFAFSGSFVPLGVLARSGGSTVFLDKWIVRRERIDATPRHYWQWRMMMRPFNVFLAQILQFQCQLHDGLDAGTVPAADDPCADTKSMLQDISPYIEKLVSLFQGSGAAADLQKIMEIGRRIQISTGQIQKQTQDRVLIGRGIIELPSAGYLPVAPGGTVSVNAQVRRLLGEGVELRFCLVRPDFVAHALEEAQHMERISLVEGLDDPDRKPAVDILVPDGYFEKTLSERGRQYEMSLQLPWVFFTVLDYTFRGKQVENAKAARMLYSGAEAVYSSVDKPTGLQFDGAARGSDRPGGGIGFHFAGLREHPPFSIVAETIAVATTEGGLQSGYSTQTTEGRDGAWLSFDIDADPTALVQGQSTRVRGEAILALHGSDLFGTYRMVDEATDIGGNLVLRLTFNGDYRVEDLEYQSGKDGALRVLGTFSGEAILRVLTVDGPQIFSLDVSVPLAVIRTPGQYGNDWRLELANPDFWAPHVSLFEVPRKWTSAVNAKVSGQVTLSPDAVGENGDTTVSLFDADQKVNKLVADPTHPAHIGAIDALRLIAKAIANQGFIDSAGNLLFPPPEGTEERSVLATLDWVLFHRRRVKNCGDDAAMPASGTRRYAVYQVGFEDDASAKVFLAAVNNNDTNTIKRFKPVFIQTVDFAAGLPSLLTSQQQLRASWRQIVGTEAGVIAGAAVAGTGLAAAEGDPLAEARGETVLGTLAKDNPVKDDLKALVLKRVPDYFAAAQNDGIIIVATLRQTVCHTVFVVEGLADRLEWIKSAASDGMKELQVALERLQAQTLGTVHFKSGTDQFESADMDAILKSWEEFTYGDAHGALVIYKKGDPANADYVKQGGAVLNQFGNDGTPDFIECPDPVSDVCVALTVIAGTHT